MDLRILLPVLSAALFGCMSAMARHEADPLQDLDRAWDEFIRDLNEARDSLKDPAYYVPPPGDRTNAEGYRYLLGQLHRLVEVVVQQDPDFPYIQKHPTLVSKYTIENPDNAYLYAPIDPAEYYRFTGRILGDYSHWKGNRNRSAERFAPNYVIFETHSVAPGDSGTTEELRDGSRVTIGKLDSSEIQVDTEGTFEILIGPEHPEGHTGNFIPTTARKGTRVQRGDIVKRDMSAHHLVIREMFGDWGREEPLEDLYIERVGAEGAYPSTRTARGTARQLRELGRLIRNHMRFWTVLYAESLDPFEQVPSPRIDISANELFAPRANSTRAGGGQVTNAMSGGYFDLAEDEALLVELDPRAEPSQMGFQLGNYWGESYDYANRVTSLNSLQAHRSSDGAYRYVISARDPGIQNWLDTAGYRSGYIVVRFTFSKMPSADELPRVDTRVIPFDRIREFLPANTPAFSRRERIEQIETRKRAVARRYRQY